MTSIHRPFRLPAPAAAAATTAADDAARLDRGGPVRRRLGIALIFLAITCYLTMSGYFLDNLGYSYTADGGAFPVKIHPGTYLLTLAFLTISLPVNPLRFVIASWQRSPALWTYSTTMTVIFAWLLFRFGTSGTAYIIDCLIVPPIVAVIARTMPAQRQRQLFLWTLTLVSVNAVIGVGEFLTQTRLTPFIISGQVIEEDYFRATALLGHPLQNALMTAMTLFILPALRHRPLLMLTLMGLMVLGLVAFGGRTAMVATLMVGLLSAPLTLVVLLRQRGLSYRGCLLTIIALIMAPLSMVMIYLVFGDEARVFQTLYWDTSAQSRLDAVRVFAQISDTDLLLGIGPQGLIGLVGRLKTEIDIITIENGWLSLALQFGLIAWVFFIGTFFWMLKTLLAGSPLYVKLAVMVFLIVASSNNSFAAKDSSLLLMVILVQGTIAYVGKR